MTFAFGGPTKWNGRSMRAAHKRMDLNEEHFQAVAEALQKTLQELGVSEPLIQEVMAIAGSTHDDVLNL